MGDRADRFAGRHRVGFGFQGRGLDQGGHLRPAKHDDRIAAFILYDDVKVYGGFAGTETALTQRPAAGRQTVLSARAAKGTYRYPHVLYGADNVLLDGLTIRDGNANGFTYHGKGGGLLAYHAGKTFLPNGLQAYAAGGALCRIAIRSALR